MRDNIPFAGSTRAKLIAAGIAHFSRNEYGVVEVDKVAAEAGVTVGSLYHHFRSKLAFYGVIRDEMTQRLLDRMEAAAEAVSPNAAVKAAVLAAYDGAVRLKIGRLVTDPDPRALDDKLARFIGELATQQQLVGAAVLGHILAAAVRAALAQAGDSPEQQASARHALERLLN